MSFNKRRIINQATQWAKEDAQELRDKDVKRFDRIRADLDLRTKEVDEMLGKPGNWYSNRYRGGSGSHEFMLDDYEFVRLFFDMIKDMSEEDVHTDLDLSLDHLEEKATNLERQRLDQLEEMRKTAGIKPTEIDNALNRTKGWFEACEEGERSMSLLAYYEVLIFLESIMLIFAREGYLEPQTLEPLVKEGYLDGDVVEMAA